MFNPVIIIPCYNHVSALSAVLPRILQFKTAIIIVDDGCDIEQSEKLQQICKSYDCTFIRHDVNRGKGAAMISGFYKAYEMGYTHALQIDSDGQHDTNDIQKFLSASEQQPNALIVGQPVYDDSAPKSRLVGRKITDFWVMVETFNRHMPDAMCGFRVYPLATTVPLLKKLRFLRMGFDIEIMVKIYRSETPLVPIETKVIYPPDGTSNFRVFKDNVFISIMHTYLCVTIPLWQIQRLKRACKRK